MPDNYQVQGNAGSDQSSDNVEDSFARLKIHEDQEGEGVAQSCPYPDRPGEPDCLYYLRSGSCGYGSNCRFNHPACAAQGAIYYRDYLPERVGQPDCEYFLKTGTCKYGSTCKYNHPKDTNGNGPVLFNMLGLPMRQDEKSCPYYMRTGSCKFGSTCKFHHPQPASLESAAVLLNGSAAYGPSVLPSAGLPYDGGFRAWSLPGTPYINGPRLPGPQGYMPLMVSPSRGMLSVPSLNTYLENSSSTNMVGSKKQPDMTSMQQPSSSQNFPERPDQPECRYYMNTGTCKYGADCKYHHPKERTAQMLSSTIKSLGLPSRPGQTVCSNYMYGLCKFGPACRFDHPLLGYPYSFGLSLPHPSMLDSSSYLTYPRISPTANSSETSQPRSSRTQDKTKNPKSSSRNESSDSKESSGTTEQAGSDS